MPVDPRLEAAFEALERTLLDSKRRLIIGEMGCAIVAEELEEAIEAAGPDVQTEDTTGVVWLSTEEDDDGA